MIFLLHIALASPRQLSAQFFASLVFPSCFQLYSLPFRWYFLPQYFPQYLFFVFPHHMPELFNRLSVIFLEACTTLVVPPMCSFLI